jgi:FkbM family methyltransferase
MAGLNRSLREKLKRIRPIRALGNAYRISRTLSILKPYQDFDLRCIDGQYVLTYTDRFGHKPDDLNVSFFFDYKQWLWQVDLNGLTVFTPGCPLFELIVELRGYLLACPLSPGDSVIDAGASTGFIASIFARMVGPTGKVVAIEPDPTNAEMLRQTLRINELQNCIVLNCALSAHSGRVSYVSDGGASHVAPSDHVAAALVQVEAIRIAALFDRVPDLRADQVRLIKLDIEGSEVDVLDDLLQLLKDNGQLVVEIASYHPYQGVQTYRWIEDRCRAFDYVAARTIYPVHTTTVLVHRDNRPVIDRLKALPAYEDNAHPA